MTVQIIEEGRVLVEISIGEDNQSPRVSLPTGTVSLSHIEEAIKIFIVKRLNALWEMERRHLN